MSGYTSIYNLFYLQAGDTVGSLASNDQNRFTAIETQLLNLYQIMNNGIINNADGTISWQLQPVPGDTAGQYVNITAGNGNINFMACTTTSTYQLTLTQPPGITSGQMIEYIIYATTDATTSYTEDTVFLASLQTEADTNLFVCLGTVQVTYSNPVQYVITTNGRVEIDLFSTISAAVKNHIHIGGQNPSPIDLGKHVRGFLSAANLSDLDISKVTQGTLNPDRLPQISHNSLADIGLVPHPQLESLIASILNQTQGAMSRLSDIGLLNLIVLILSLKRQLFSGADTDIMYDIDNRLYNSIYYLPHKWSYQLEANNLPGTQNYATIDRVNRQIVGTGSQFFGSNTYVWNSIAQYEVSEALLNNISTPPINNITFGTEESTQQYFTIDTPLNFTAINELNSTTWVDAIDTQALGNGTNMKLFFRRLYYRMFNSTETTDWTNLSTLVHGFALQYLNSVGTSEAFPDDVYMFFILSSSNLTLSGANANGAVQLQVSTPFKIYDHTVDTFPLPLEEYQFDGGLQMNGKIVVTDISTILTASQVGGVLGFGYFYQNFSGISEPTESTEVNEVQLDTAVSIRLYPVSSSYVASNSDFSTFSDTVLSGIEADLPSIGTDNGHGLIIPPGSPSPISFFGFNTVYCAESAVMIFRLGNNFPSTEWQQVFIQLTTSSLGASTPFAVSGDPRLLIKTRIANSAGNLNSESQFVTINTTPGQTVFPIPAPDTGSVIDVAFYLFRDPVDASLAPRIDSVALTYSGPGMANFNTWATQQDWGTTNVPFLNKLSYVLTQTPNIYSGVGVGSISNTQYGLQLSDTENLGAYLFFDSASNSFKQGIINAGTQTETQIFTPSALYLSPRQQWQSLNSGFLGAMDVFYPVDGSIVVADTVNDRIIQIDSDGSLIKSLQGNIRLSQTARDLAVLSAIYNPILGCIYVLFSQNVIIKNSTLISIVINNEYYQCGTATLPVVLFSPIQSVSSTIQIQILDSTFNTFLSSVGTANSSNIQVNINQGSVEWVAPVVFGPGGTGSSGGTSGGGTGGTGGTGGGGSGGGSGGGPSGQSIGPVRIMSVPPFFVNSYPGGTGNDIPGLNIITPPVADPVYFPTNTTGSLIENSLLAYQTNNGVCTVNVDSGNIVMANIMAPTSIQVLQDGSWYIANSAPYSVQLFNQFLSQTSQISSSVAPFILGHGGSVYQVDDTANTILMALPAPSGGQGQLNIIKGTNGFTLYFPQGDCVKALPDVNNTGYFVLINDLGVNAVSQSQLIYISINGDYLWTWGAGQGSNTLVKPTNMSILTNGNIIISE